MVKKILCTVIYAMLNVAIAANDKAPPHYDAECVACHEQMVSGDAKVLYTRKDRLAKNYHELQQRVRYCKDQLGLDWSEGQTHAVVEYLAKNYYDYRPQE